MDLKVEAQRVMAVALGKMYNSRLQRGGIRLHKSLLLSLVLRSARDIYLNVRAEQQDVEAGQGDKLEAEAMEVEDGERGAERKGEECIQPRDCIQSDSGCIQPRDCIQSDSGCIQPRDCIQSDSGCIQPRDCIQSDSGCVQPRDCIQSDSGCNQPRDCIQSDSGCNQPRDCIQSDSGCNQPRDCIQSDSGCVQPRDCIQSDSGCNQPRDCIQSDSGCNQPRDCIQSDSGCVQPRDCIQSDSGCNQPRDCIHCDRDRVSECPQLSVPEPGARDPCVRPREAARRPGLTRDRKRRKGSDQRDPPDPECLPSKRARLEEEEEEPRSLVRVRGLGKAAADSPREQPLSPGHLCRHRALGKRGIWVRVVVAY
ncbi:uncharacterized protein LOC121271195 isoform X2 [Carcharodon carcharias]|uniref:uncharacterized protein LOC121271195 isoform X2 n=1 Tax=Carcharodon carcharias TaxID=13397 RepID=UPI001B7F0901|nr:uncharacterized protein LOC121271195 isoform X2 [Carcharodon carcharias]